MPDDDWKELIRNPDEHSCSYCPTKKLKLQEFPEFIFRPSTLSQQILLELGYATFGKPSAVDTMPLPDLLINLLKRIHVELWRWNGLISSSSRVFRRGRFRFHDEDHFHFRRPLFTLVGGSEQSLEMHCFMRQLHWTPDLEIDAETSTRMILRCGEGICKRSQFMLAVKNCLEDEIIRLWPLLESPVMGFQWQSPVLSYWIRKCKNQPVDPILGRMATSDSEEIMQSITIFKYFWPLITQFLGGIDSDKMREVYSHAFHQSIETEKFDVASFIRQQSPSAYHRSMVSSDHCCARDTASTMFKRALGSGYGKLALFIFGNMSQNQRNHLLFDEKAETFCMAVELDCTDIVTALWEMATSNHRFVMRFGQDCGAFRMSCSKGHLKILQLLWTDASDAIKRQMLTIRKYEALTLACRYGQLDVFVYLWESMGDELRQQFLITCEDDAILSHCIVELVSPLPNTGRSSSWISGKKLQIWRYLFSKSDSTNRPTTQQLFRGLLFDDAIALKALVAERGENVKEISELLKIFDSNDQAQLRSKMMELGLCGLENE